MKVLFSKIRKGSRFEFDGESYTKINKTQGEDWDAKKRTFKPDTEVEKAAKRKSRVELWNDLVAEARRALDKARDLEDQLSTKKEDIESALTDAKSEVVSALETLKEMAEEMSEPYDNMPDSLQQSPYGQKCEAMQQIDLECSDDDELDELEEKINEAEGAELPLGFGRD